MKILFTNQPQIKVVKWDNYKEFNWEWSKVNRDEIKKIIFLNSTKLITGPDEIFYLII